MGRHLFPVFLPRRGRWPEGSEGASDHGKKTPPGPGKPERLPLPSVALGPIHLALLFALLDGLAFVEGALAPAEGELDLGAAV